MNAYTVTLHGKFFDVVFDMDTDPKEVKRSLINHDGYDPNINVRRRNLKRTNK